MTPEEVRDLTLNPRFDGLPVIVDEFVPKDTVYVIPAIPGLNEKSLVMNQENLWKIAGITPGSRTVPEGDFACPQEIPAPGGFAESLAAFRAARRSGGQPAAEQLLRERMLAEAKADLEAQRVKFYLVASALLLAMALLAILALVAL